MSVNKATLCGNVGNAPEIKILDNGRKVAKFSLATTEKYTDKNNQQVEQTEWHNIVSWRHADIIEKYVAKGDKIYLEGKIVTRKWEKDGQQHSTTEIDLNSIELFAQRKDTIKEPTKYNGQSEYFPSKDQRAAQQQPAVNPLSGTDDDLPF